MRVNTDLFGFIRQDNMEETKREQTGQRTDTCLHGTQAV